MEGRVLRAVFRDSCTPSVQPQYTQKICGREKRKEWMAKAFFLRGNTGVRTTVGDTPVRWTGVRIIDTTLLVRLSTRTPGMKVEFHSRE